MTTVTDTTQALANAKQLLADVVRTRDLIGDWEDNTATSPGGMVMRCTWGNTVPVMQDQALIRSLFTKAPEILEEVLEALIEQLEPATEAEPPADLSDPRALLVDSVIAFHGGTDDFIPGPS